MPVVLLTSRREVIPIKSVDFPAAENNSCLSSEFRIDPALRRMNGMKDSNELSPRRIIACIAKLFKLNTDK